MENLENKKIYGVAYYFVDGYFGYGISSVSKVFWEKEDAEAYVRALQEESNPSYGVEVVELPAPE